MLKSDKMDKQKFETIFSYFPEQLKAGILKLKLSLDWLILGIQQSSEWKKSIWYSTPFKLNHIS